MSDNLEVGASSREIIKDKLRQNFDGKIVRKDLTKKIKEGANVPVYVLEFLLGQYCSSDDDEVIEQDGDVVRPPRAQAALLPAPVAERPVRRREVRRALQLLRPDFRQAHDVAVHHGVKGGSDERLELVHDLELRV